MTLELPARKIARYGWRPDLPDFQDYKFDPTTTTLPTHVDLRNKLPACWDQGQLGSCTAHGIGAAVVFLHPDLMPSRLFIYYNERVIEGDVNQDGGAQVRDGIKVVHKLGTPPETEWPYVIREFKIKPPQTAFDDALKCKIASYHRITAGNLDDMKACLAQGFPFVFGFTVYASFESAEVAKTGIVPMPSGKAIGGHCTLAVGYDDANKTMIVRNSWGTSWGDNGHFHMPYDYIASKSLCSDFWTLRV